MIINKKKSGKKKNRATYILGIILVLSLFLRIFGEKIANLISTSFNAKTVQIALLIICLLFSISFLGSGIYDIIKLKSVKPESDSLNNVQESKKYKKNLILNIYGFLVFLVIFIIFLCKPIKM